MMNKECGGGNTSALSKLEQDRLRKRYYEIKRNGGVMCPEWENISGFMAWAKKQEIGYFDYLIPNFWKIGCKVFGPDSAAFVPREVGDWLCPYPATDKLLLGVRFKDKKASGFDRYITSSMLCREETVRAIFYTQIETHRKFLEFRLEIVDRLAAKLKDPRKRAAFLLRAERVTEALRDNIVLNEL